MDLEFTSRILFLSCLYFFILRCAHAPLPQLHKPDAVVRAYRAFVESFGDSFAPPPARGGARQSQLTREDLMQKKRSQHLSEVRLVSISIIDVPCGRLGQRCDAIGCFFVFNHPLRK